MKYKAQENKKTPAGATFFAPVQTGPGAHPVSYTMSTGFFSRALSGRGVTLTAHSKSSAEVKERVELYICFSCGSSWPVVG